MTATRSAERQTMLDELDLRRRQMDSLSGEFYDEAHAACADLVKRILDDAGLSLRLGKAYTTPVARNHLRRVEVLRDGKVVRTLDVPNGPAAYVRAFAIDFLSRP